MARNACPSRFDSHHELAGDEDHDASREGGLGVHRGDVVLAFLEGQGHQLCDNVLGSLRVSPVLLYGGGAKHAP